MNENIKAEGTLRLRIHRADGALIEKYEANNLVVDLGRKNVAKLIGGDAAGKKVNTIAVGEGTSAPAVADSLLTNQFDKPVDAVTYPADNKVQFSFSIASGEANGFEITEFGLLNDDGTLFSRKTRSAISKTSDIIITGIWTITIN